jgi:hypothetical protein
MRSNVKNSGKMLSIFASYEQTFGWSLHVAVSTFIPNIGKPVSNITCHIILVNTDYESYNLDSYPFLLISSP